MNTALRLGGYATALALVFGAAWGVGTAVGEPQAAHPGVHAEPDGPAAASDGLAATAGGYTFVPQVDTLVPGAPTEFAFTIAGPDGRAVTAFDVVHGQALHLVVVRRDAVGLQHLNPGLGVDGVWRVPLALPTGGVYRAYADFVPTGGPALTLGTDLFAPGDFTPIPLPPSRVAQVDGYQVRLDGELVPGTDSPVFATVSRDGVAVTDLEPHLGAFGQLVALRRGDLAYLRLRPAAPAADPGARSGPGIAFTARVPLAGAYRLFLDFRHGGIVRTAEFTVDTPEG